MLEFRDIEITDKKQINAAHLHNRILWDVNTVLPIIWLETSF